MSALRKLGLALPLVVVLAGIVRGEVALRTGQPFRFRIAGFDPRDLLSGHYLQFRIAYDFLESRDAARPPSSGVGDAPPPVSVVTCANVPSDCRAFLRRELADRLTRFYVPESEAPRLEDELRSAARDESAYVVVRVDEQGVPTVQHLELHGHAIDGSGKSPR